MDMTDSEPAEVSVRLFTRGKAQAAFDGPRKPFVDNPEPVLSRNGRQSGVVAQNLVHAVLANEREQLLMDIAKLDLGRVLSPDHLNAVLGFVGPDRTDRVVPKVLQQLKAIAGPLAQLFAQFAQRIGVLGQITVHTSS